MIISFKGKSPVIAPDSFIADTATLIGDVILGEETSIWFGAVLRGDINQIKIGRFTNIQDNCVVHVSGDVPTVVGEYVTVGHGAIIHGGTIGDNCLIGMGSIILDKSVIGDGCLIAAGALVKEKQIIPPGSLVVGNPGIVKRQLSSDEQRLFKEWAINYRGYAKNYM
ncbi:MAG: gamma carbonic anhydrase family protein [candidate division Zixibacteria bacterium]|jgi:carbonic anhydrase/acetyltransferase-like protein (isoleucine patch superfamily)|nr:gamma carbonic anhydrase family protein [candidate division Zixibacteria bacterium]